MTTQINIKCKSCGKLLKVPASLIGKTGKCPACKETIKLESPESHEPKATPKPNQEPPLPLPNAAPVLPGGLVPKPSPAKIDTIPSHATEVGRDRERFAAAISVAPDKFPIVEPYLMDYESTRAIALQRQFPFTFFSDIALLTSHRLMVFKRFFTKVTMIDLNYIDFGDVTIRQGFFTSAITIAAANGRIFSIDKLITDQALTLYRHCQDIETKARIARRQYQLEENRSRTNQMQINNIPAQPALPQAIDARAIAYRDISNVGDEQRDPFKLGE
jgi:phage FluMu protein Com